MQPLWTSLNGAGLCHGLKMMPGRLGVKYVDERRWDGYDYFQRDLDPMLEWFAHFMQ